MSTLGYDDDLSEYKDPKPTQSVATAPRSSRNVRREIVPLAVQRLRPATRTAHVAAKARAATILVVDDDADLCRNLADILSDIGYDVDVARSGEHGLDQACRRSYDVVLLDVNLPGMDGVALCRRLKEIQPKIVALIITAYAADGVAENARTAGAACVMEKPLDCARLLSRIQGLLG
jgi:CheY-like chemotaxis protein